MLKTKEDQEKEEFSDLYGFFMLSGAALAMYDYPLRLILTYNFIFFPILYILTQTYIQKITFIRVNAMLFVTILILYLFTQLNYDISSCVIQFLESQLTLYKLLYLALTSFCIIIFFTKVYIKWEKFIHTVINYLDLYSVMKWVKLFYHKFYYDTIVNSLISKKILKYAYYGFKLFDKGILEILGPEGLISCVWMYCKNFKLILNGYAYNYFCIFTLIVFYIMMLYEYGIL